MHVFEFIEEALHSAEHIPAPPKTQPITIRLRNEEVEQIDRMATVMGITRSMLIRRLVENSADPAEKTLLDHLTPKQKREYLKGEAIT